MPIVNIIKKASSYILGYDESADKDDQIYEDNEVLFCKNNICVHPPAFARQESDILHYPGYLTVTTKTFVDQYNNAKRPTLMLTWIPNATLRKCPSTVENAIHRQYSEELKQNKFLQHLNEKNTIKSASQISLISTQSVISNNTNPFLEPYFCSSPFPDKKVSNNENGDNFDVISVSSNSDKASVSTHSRDDAVDDEDVFIVSANESQPTKEETEEEIQLKRELQPLLGSEDGVDTVPNLKLPFPPQQTVTSVNITIANPRIQNHDISPTDSVKLQNDKFMRTLSTSSQDENFSPNWMTPELFAYKHNLSFPDSATASPIVTRKQVPLKCRRSVNGKEKR